MKKLLGYKNELNWQLTLDMGITNMMINRALRALAGVGLSLDPEGRRKVLGRVFLQSLVSIARFARSHRTLRARLIRFPNM